MKYSGEKKKLVEVSELITRGITPAYTENSGVIVLNQKCIRENRVNWELSRLTDPEKRKISKDKQLQTYDILVNSTGVGTLGRVAQVKEFNINATVDSHVTIVRPNKYINPEFLGYSLYYQQANIENLSEGSTGQTELSRVNLGEQIIINVLPLEVQNKTVRILSSIDKKIDNNNLLIKALESKSELVFKHWFIDFEFPNEEGQPYKSSGGEMVESELGMIPKGWRILSLNEYAAVGSGKRPKIKVDSPSMVYEYPIIGASKIMGYTDDFLFQEEIIVMGRVGTHGIIQNYKTKVWPSDNTLVLRSNYIYFLEKVLKQIDFKSLNRGSTQPLITQSDIKKVLTPFDEGKVEKYEKLVLPLKGKIYTLEKENEKLIKLRDTLLPKLLSGEIEVPVKEPESV